jgi:hypothetical protein
MSEVISMIERIEFYRRIVEASITEARREREAERHTDEPDRDEGGRVPLVTTWMDGTA